MHISIGKEYIIDHSRKGTFRGRIESISEEWVTVTITMGRAHYISYMNQARGCVGDKITIRKSFCKFKEV